MRGWVIDLLLCYCTMINFHFVPNCEYLIIGSSCAAEHDVPNERNTIVYRLNVSCEKGSPRLTGIFLCCSLEVLRFSVRSMLLCHNDTGSSSLWFEPKFLSKWILHAKSPLDEVVSLSVWFFKELCLHWNMFCYCKAFYWVMVTLVKKKGCF